MPVDCRRSLAACEHLGLIFLDHASSNTLDMAESKGCLKTGNEIFFAGAIATLTLCLLPVLLRQLPKRIIFYLFLSQRVFALEHVLFAVDEENLCVSLRG